MVATLPLRRSNLSPVLGLLLAVLLISAALPASHAVIRHGDDALAVRQCLRERGPALVFRDRVERDKYYLMCELPDGRWGLQVVKDLKTRLQEITSFIRRDPTFQGVKTYIERHATRYTGPLP